MNKYRLLFKNTNKISVDSYNLERAKTLQSTIKRLFKMEVDIVEEKTD